MEAEPARFDSAHHIALDHTPPHVNSHAYLASPSLKLAMLGCHFFLALWAEACRVSVFLDLISRNLKIVHARLKRQGQLGTSSSSSAPRRTVAKLIPVAMLLSKGRHLRLSPLQAPN